jgi:hypothetical protein
MTKNEIDEIFNLGYENGLVNGQHHGEVQERERIIALLDAWLADDNGDFDATLALIKGDKALIIQDNNLNYIMGDDK